MEIIWNLLKKSKPSLVKKLSTEKQQEEFNVYVLAASILWTTYKTKMNWTVDLFEIYLHDALGNVHTYLINTEA